MCAVTGRVFEPVGLMERDLDLVWSVARHSTESIVFARLYFTDAFTFACAIVKRSRASCSSGDGASALFLLDGMPVRCF